VSSLKPLTPNFNRINPLSGIANLFSKQQLTNALKMTVMSAILFALGWMYVSRSLQQVAALVLQPSPAAIRELGQWLVSGVSLLMMVVIAAAIVDVPLQLFFHKRKLRMSHQELKQEHKESDGNPQLKGKQRSNARELSQRASITAVPKADFVLMNPTHFAVAMRYDDQSMSAPQVISKGSDLLAMRIRDIAKSHNIPVIQSPMLARALYAHAELDQPIPTSLYTAVAQVLAYVYRLKAALRGEGSMPGEPPEPVVPPELDPLNKKALPSLDGAAA
jgi:flagellar biosynthetic protein FlhB